LVCRHFFQDPNPIPWRAATRDHSSDEPCLDPRTTRETVICLVARAKAFDLVFAFFRLCVCLFFQSWIIK